MFTTQGWSNQVARIYLKSMLEFTHPGFQNTGVDGLRVGEGGAPVTGSYRNITTGGIEDSAGFTERADGILVYVPGWGEQGILLGLAGGTADTFTEMTNIDVYDIATSTWYKQSTAGTPPPPRVNPCAVVFAAPDASSFQVHLYGGQDLIPTGNQTQYGDMWILTVPSFTWISVPAQDNAPVARAGHSCHASDGQIIVIGGYVGKSILCDSPGMYVFNASSLTWSSDYTSLSSSSSESSTTAAENGADSGLDGSYGYTVPDAVQSVIGGGPYGSAAISVPAAGTPTSGPIATGKPPVFTITQAGSTVTAQATSTVSSSSSSDAAAATGNGKNHGAIAAGTIAGVLAGVAAYLAFCTWLYRRQVKVYRRHVAMSQRASGGYLMPPQTVFGDRSEKVSPSGPRPLLGAFGTDISQSNHSGSTSTGSGAPVFGRMSGGSADGGASSYERVRDHGDNSGAYLAPQRTAETTHTTISGYHRPGAPPAAAAAADYPWEGSSVHTTGSMGSMDDLVSGQEMSFFSVVMSPRRTLRVINRD